MPKSILLLSDLSYATGLIGLVELEERLEIADWLFGNTKGQSDPRGPMERSVEANEPVPDQDVFQPIRADKANATSSTAEARSPEPEVMQFLALRRWHFTISDPDCAPSVPHGHENAKTQKWPKLNPYTGKVFTAIHSEDTTRRLSREEMKALWRNADFVEHCRNQVNWYSRRFPGYRFVNARRGTLAFPRW
jgi:hypothetical protein